MTKHHILFPETMWEYSPKSRKLRNAFVVKLTANEHGDMNAWIEGTIGYIPPLPPRELNAIYDLVESRLDAPLKDRLDVLLSAIKKVADKSSTPAVKTSLYLTLDNLQQQVDYLNIRGYLTRQLPLSNPAPVPAPPPIATPPEPITSTPASPPASIIPIPTPIPAKSIVGCGRIENYLRRLRRKTQRGERHKTRRDYITHCKASQQISDAIRDLNRTLVYQS